MFSRNRITDTGQSGTVMDKPSERILFCGVKTWGLLIGYLEMVLSCITLLLGIIGVASGQLLVPFLEGEFVNENPNSELTPEDKLIEARIYCIVLIILSILDFLMATLLIAGVKQINATKVKVWTYFQLVVVIFSFVIFVELLFLESTTSLLSITEHILGLVINAFFWWVVKVHLRELEKDLQSQCGGSENPAFSCELGIELKDSEMEEPLKNRVELYPLKAAQPSFEDTYF